MGVVSISCTLIRREVHIVSCFTFMGSQQHFIPRKKTHTKSIQHLMPVVPRVKPSTLASFHRAWTFSLDSIQYGSASCDMVVGSTPR